MRIVRIPKKNGKYRVIYVPPRQQRAELRELIPKLAELFMSRGTARAVHGFLPDRSPVTNALAHVNRAITVNFDLRDFFDTVTEDKLLGLLPQDLLQQVLVDGAARQGLPTSPMVANLAAVLLDQAILRWVRAQDPHTHTVYTRYADDLTISTDCEHVADAGLATIPQLVAICGFTIAEEKTKIYRASAGRRMVTGIAVDDGLHPTRRLKRRLRAARHQGNTSQAAGLTEWCRLRIPRNQRQALLRQLREDFGKSARAFTLPGYEDIPEGEPPEMTPTETRQPVPRQPPSVPATTDTPHAGRTRSIVLR